MKKYIRTPLDVFRYVTFLRYQKQEHMRVLYLTKDKELICSLGLESEEICSISFTAKDIFRTAIIAGASGLILVHNHPSGNIKPSKEDIEVTKKVICLGELIGIRVIDHIIVTKSEFQSILSFCV